MVEKRRRNCDQRKPTTRSGMCPSFSHNFDLESPDVLRTPYSAEQRGSRVTDCTTVCFDSSGVQEDPQNRGQPRVRRRRPQRPRQKLRRRRPKRGRSPVIPDWHSCTRLGKMYRVESIRFDVAAGNRRMWRRQRPGNLRGF